MMTGFINWISNGTAEHVEKQLCPILNDPAPDCYCNHMNNRNILLALRFCVSNFNHCAVYKRFMKNKILNPLI